VQHLHGLGHRRIAYVGGNDHFSNGRDRWSGFVAACEELKLEHRPDDVVRAQAWHLDEKERMALMRAFSADDRPSAVFAAGYHFALDTYGVATSAGLRVPEDLSIVGVDDPPSAAHLSPALTTLRQPLIQLGHSAVTTLYEQIQSASHDAVSRTLWAELITRRSTQRPAGS
jgi:GntR family transcriptional regulator, arabinose operon transcriptional repressor